VDVLRFSGTIDPPRRTRQHRQLTGGQRQIESKDAAPKLSANSWLVRFFFGFLPF
jgi:hypothetical protein